MRRPLRRGGLHNALSYAHHLLVKLHQMPLLIPIERNGAKQDSIASLLYDPALASLDALGDLVHAYDKVTR